MSTFVPTQPRVSVVIPTYNEAAYIGDCLWAIVSGTLPPHEIIVADGMSSDGTDAIAREYGATVLHNTKRTASSGRNMGIAIATGDVIAFTDGDCLPSADWVENITTVFAEADVDAVSGAIVPCEPENEYESYWNHLAWEVLMHFDEEPRPLTTHSIDSTIVTANCAYTKEALTRLGGFDNWFGNNAEDTDLSWRAIDAGMNAVYDPRPIVYAHGETTLQGIRKKAFRNGVSSSKLQKRYGGLVSFDSSIYRMLVDNLTGHDKPETAKLNRNELIAHLLGKYYGAVRFRVINF